jgi:glyceraldehyde-3-phosphate dehydrogenase/erythrose-4-phosphate dehydrogenase
MKTRVAINGLGRIGRAAMKLALEEEAPSTSSP